MKTPAIHSTVLLRAILVCAWAGHVSEGALTAQGSLSGSKLIVLKEFMMQPPADPKKPPPVPEMVGATSAPFLIGPGTTEIVLAVHAPTGPASHAARAPRDIFFRAENITSNVRSPSFRVYLNLPKGVNPEEYQHLFIGNLAMFGLVEASRTDGTHAADGLHFKLEATEVYNRLAASPNWDPQTVRISFVPASWDAPVPQVTVGRFSMYFQ